MTACAAARTWGRVAIRLTAGLLLVAIGADLAADARCDATTPLAGSLSVRTEERDPRTSGDACAPVCVPDCFCCSRSTAASAAVFPADLGPLVVLDTPLVHLPSEGVVPLVYHPPLSRA